MSRMRLKDIAVEKNEREDNPSQSPYSIFVGLEHYDSGEATIRRYGSTEMLESTMKVFHAEDILVARRNVYLRRAAAVDFDGLTSGDSIVLHIENEAYRRIVPFVLNTDDFWNYANQHADGSMSKRLSPKLLMEYEFSLPDNHLDQVSGVLWAMERVKNAYRELIVKTDELVKSQFVEMFGDCISNDKGWNSKPLYEVLAEGCTVTYGIVKTEDDIPGGVPVFRPVDISQGHVPVRSELKRTSEAISNQYRRTLLHGDELLITVRGSIGETFQISSEFAGCNVARNIVPLRADTEVLLQSFLKIVLDSPAFQRKLADLTKGVALKGINMNEFKLCPIILPPLELQEQFSRFVDQTDKSKLAATQALEDITNAQKALMRQCLG